VLAPQVPAACPRAWHSRRSRLSSLVRRGDLLAVKLGGRGQWRVERAKLEEFIAALYTDTATFVRDNPYPGRGEAEPGRGPRVPARSTEAGARRPARGPRRALTASPAEIADWVGTARRRGEEGERARERMQAAARSRQLLIARLYAAGLSHRELAAALGVSPTVVAPAQVLTGSETGQRAEPGDQPGQPHGRVSDRGAPPDDSAVRPVDRRLLVAAARCASPCPTVLPPAPRRGSRPATGVRRAGSLRPARYWRRPRR
jgi:hypothetical protein